jgi:hypothetical protein
LSERNNELENQEAQIVEMVNENEQQNIEIQIEDDFTLEEKDQEEVVSAEENQELASTPAYYVPLRRDF